MRVGTSHFVSFKAAVLYYYGQSYLTKKEVCEEVKEKLRARSIHLGRPKAEGGDIVLIDGGCRYAIVTKENL